MLDDFKYLLAPTSVFSTINDDYLFPDGKPSLQRAKLHKSITDECLERATSTNLKKVFLIIGPPGTGKTTFANSILHKTGLTFILDADNIKLALLREWVLRGYIPNELNFLRGLTSEEFGVWELAGGLVHQESTYLGRHILNTLIRNKRNFILVTVLSDFNHFQSLVTRLFYEHYDIQGFLLLAPFDICVERCFKRWHDARECKEVIAGEYAGGRFVSKEYIRSCFLCDSDITSVSEKNLHSLQLVKFESYINVREGNQSYIHFRLLPLGITGI